MNLFDETEGWSVRFDLAGLRKNAKLTQTEIAQRSGLPQSQVSRIEASPEKASVEDILKFLGALGISPAEFFSVIGSNRAKGLDPGRPLSALFRNLDLLKAYVNAASDELRELEVDGFSLQALVDGADVAGRKPNLVLCGAYDTGKSRLANAFLGGDFLPTGYQPTTRIKIFVRHLKDRPHWLLEDTLVLDDGFAYWKWTDEAHCIDHKVVAGGLEVIRSFSGPGDIKDQRAASALVFLDAPILEACNIVDLPGFSGDSADGKLAEDASRIADVLIYTSTAKGFLTAMDFERLKFLLRKLRIYEHDLPGFPTLGNLFIVATQADSTVKDPESILTSAVRRMLNDMPETLALVAKDRGREISEAALLDRMFVYWNEDPERRKALENSLQELLTQHLPCLMERNADNWVTDWKSKSVRAVETFMAHIEKVKEKRNELERKYQELKRREPTRQQNVISYKMSILDSISRARQEHLKVVKEAYKDVVDEEIVEGMIKAYYKDSKEAQKNAPGRVLDQVLKRVDEIGLEKSRKLAVEIESFIKLYENASVEIGTCLEFERLDSQEIPFDVRGAFIGAMAGLGTIGALGVWAASMGPLGGYILTAKAVSILATLGVSISGGTAAGISLVASIGGPITVAIGLALVAAMIAYTVFGDSWQRRLAAKICKAFEEKRVKNRIILAVERYWQDTERAFRTGADKLEEEFGKKLQEIEALIRDGESPVELTSKLNKMLQLKNILAGVPWRQLQS